MNEKKKLQPKVRFREFTGENAPDWEQRKLGELVDVCSGRDYKHLSEGTIPVYGTGGYMLSVNDALSYDRDAIGIGRKGTIDRPYILKAPFWTVDTLFYAIPREKVDLNFAFDIFQNIDWKKKDESTGVPSLSKTAINDIDVLAPKHDEQQTIGQFFAALDDLITLHQRKLEQLEQLKNTLLSKMFPKSGTNIPEIRFSGFTDAWKQRKLEYFLEVSNEKNTDNLYSKENVLSVSGDFGVVNQIEFQGRSFAGVSVTNYGVLNTGDVVYTKSPLKANPYGIIKTNKGQPGIVSSLYGIYHTKEITVADFVQIYFEQNARLNNYLRPLVNKGAKNTILISDTEALKGRVCFAPTYEEQYIIATLFNHLDKLITFHQRNLDNLKNMKKTLLNKMFI